GVLPGVVTGDLRGRLACPEQLAHGFHRGPDVAEERLVTGTQVVQARLAVGGAGEPVLGAAAVAGETHVAPAAEPGPGSAVGQAELYLPGRSDQFEHCRLADVAESVTRLHEVVA